MQNNFYYLNSIFNSKGIKFILFAFVFLLFNITSTRFLNDAKVDLTYDKLYTLSENTKEIVSNLKEPIKIQFFFSNSLSKEIAQIRDYEKRVRELLNKYVKISKQNIELEIIDPKPFTDQEDLANVYGIQGLQLNEEGENFYFGAVISNSVDDTIVIPFFDLNRESFLEYDLTKTIYNLANTSKRVIGLISDLPFIGQVSNSAQGPQYEEPFYLYSRMKDLFNVTDLSTSVSSIPDNIDQLLVIHPKNLPDETLYAIDQFIMSGKGVIVFVDPFSEYEQNKSLATTQEVNIPSSNLERLFNSWGITVKPGMIIGDIINGRKVSLGSPNNQKIVTYLIWLAIQNENLSKEDIVTTNLDYIFIKSAGSIENLNTNKTLTVEPLVSTSIDSMLIERFKMQFRADPEELLKNFSSQNKSFIIGARIKGNFNSAFTLEDIKNFNINSSGHIESVNNANLLVYSDTDLLADSTWVSKQDMFGRNNITPIADNGRLVINSIEAMSGGSNLIGLRGRGTSNRPFLVIEKLQKNAELLFREKEQSLQNELEETERKLQEIQSNTSDIKGKSSEQSLAIEEFQNKIYQIRKELRDVQRRLNADIDRLEALIKLVNIWLMPILVVMLYISIRYVAMRKRKVFNKEIGRLAN